MTRIPLEEVVRLPAPGGRHPVSVRFSPDDALVTFLHDPDGGLTRRLFAFDVAGGSVREVFGGRAVREESLSLDEALQRERQRQRGLGVTAYQWARRGRRVMVPASGAVIVIEDPGASLPPVEVVVSGAQHAKISPDGAFVAYVSDGAVHVAPSGGGASTRVTAGSAEPGVTQGLAEFMAQEELGRSDGFWWSDDGGMIAFAEVDERHIPEFSIVHQGKDEPFVETHRYPFAGRQNALVRLGVVSRTGGAPVWCDLGDDHDTYLARVKFFPDGSLYVQVIDRDQQRLSLRRVDPRDGSSEIVLVEETDVWINVHDVLEPLPGGGFLWASERSGYRHLYRHDPVGGRQVQLTRGEWMVTALNRVDAASGMAHVTATAESPLERHLYSVPLDGGAPRRITRAPGTHQVVVDHGGRVFVDTWSDASAPTRVTLRSLPDDGEVAVLHDEPDERVESLGLRPPEYVEVATRDGAVLHAALYAPDGPGPHPLVVSVYGGPHAQRVTRSWSMTSDMRAQRLRSLGVCVVTCDNRGSANRGLAFEGAIRNNLGDLEVRDQADAVAALVARGIADPARVGVYGWSYGGYMALMCLARAPDVFRAAVAGAPVTHWDGYDTCYTERYMSTPGRNPGGYERSSVMAHVSAIDGRLLLVHGMLDENVHFRHTARLVNALHAAGKDYELLVFPDERHVPRRRADRRHTEERVTRFLLESLSADGPAAAADRL